MIRFFVIVIAAVWIISIEASAATAAKNVDITVYPVGTDEFVGPFANWINVKTGKRQDGTGSLLCTGAVGDGIADDTVALQSCLNVLSSSVPTLYVPSGSYRITSTLTLAVQVYINIIGQNPPNTIILWGGASGGTMLYLNGVAYSRFNRLTFNGQGIAAVAVDQSKADGTSNYFDTGNEYADDVFENAGTGLRCGNLDFGCAETSMLRDKFINNTVAGIAMRNANALDMFIWYGLFQNNFVGVTNFSGAGNFHVYNSVFQNSTGADMEYTNTGAFNIRNNYSSGSNYFFYGGGTSSTNTAFLQGNVILDNTSLANGVVIGGRGSVFAQDRGPLILLDNIIRNAVSVPTGPAAFGNDIYSMGNTFTVTPSLGNISGSHFHSVLDQVVNRSTINPTQPTLPSTPANLGRTIFEIPPGATTAQIQTAITNAAAGCSNNVAHIQTGTYNITATLTVPSNCKVQMIGDGYNSRLVSSGANPVLRLTGPSKATLRDFSISGNSGVADGLEVNGADQAQAHIFMEQATLSQSSRNLWVDSLDYAYVEAHNFYEKQDASAPSVVITGGTQAAAGNWLGGATNIFAGASCCDLNSYAVSSGAHVAVIGFFFENGGGTNIATVTGGGAFTLAGATLHLSGTDIAISGMQNGVNSLVGNALPQGTVSASGSGSGGSLLGLGLVGPTNPFFSNITSPAADYRFLNGQTISSELPEIGAADASFMTTALNQLRSAVPSVPADRPSGVTDVRMYRVFVDISAAGIHLKP